MVYRHKRNTSVYIRFWPTLAMNIWHRTAKFTLFMANQTRVSRLAALMLMLCRTELS